MIRRAELPVEALTLDPMQSRERAWSGDELDQRLAKSIDDDGLFHDILVRPLGDVDYSVDLGVTTNTELDTDSHDSVDAKEDEKSGEKAEYAIIAGSRRYHAAMEAGYETIPCKVFEASDLDAAWTSLTENTDRRELSEQEIAQQLNLIYELVRPRDDVHPDGDTTESETDTSGGDHSRFETEREALEYLARRFRGNDGDNAVKVVTEHLETAALPPILQSLFKDPENRSAQEQMALDNYGIDTRSKLGSGEGKSGTSREVVALHETLESVLETDSVDPTDAVLEAVGSLQFDEMSENELRQTLRQFRHEATAELSESSPVDQRQVFSETLQQHSAEARELYEEVEPARPFKRVDVMGPETQRHSRWHVQAMRTRGIETHSELVRSLYEERLEQLADEEGWV